MATSKRNRTKNISLQAFLEKRLNLRTGQLLILAQDSDWEFVVKSHTLIEASLNRLLIGYFNDDRINPFLVQLNVNDEKRGKLGLIKALQLLGDEHRAFIKEVTDIRNNLVHDARNLTFDLRAFIASSQKQVRITKVLADAMITLPEWPESHTMQIAKSDPRLALEWGILGLMTIVEDRLAYVSKRPKSTSKAR